jgi:hypothetical protein
VTLSNALSDQDRFDEAATAARRSRDAAASDDLNAQALWRSTLAKALAHQDASAGHLVSNADGRRGARTA